MTSTPSLLLVDDHEVFRERAARAFRERGFEVRTAGSVKDALSHVVDETPELAVVDLSLPDGSGLEVLRALRDADESTRVVMLTGYGSVATAVDAIRLGAVHYLQKPADVDAILAAFHADVDSPVLAANAVYDPPSLERVEWEHIQRVLSDCGGNVSEAARRLRIHRRSLQRKLQRWAPPE
jgi:two-component system response regulator RegA